MKALAQSLLFCFLGLKSVAQDDLLTSASGHVRFSPSITTRQLMLAGKQIPVSVYQYGDVKDIICINLHDDEQTSVKAAHEVLGFTGGTLIKFQNSNQRLLKFTLDGIRFSIDPNRIFSREGILQTLTPNRRPGKKAEVLVEKFANELLSMIPDSINCLIALHNNSNEYYSIKSYLRGGNRQKDARAVYEAADQDIDDIAFTTDSVLYNMMANNGYNTIWQDREMARKDGSLSIYCAEKNIRYINIETEHGRQKQYVEMLGKLMHFLEKEREMIENLNAIMPSGDAEKKDANN